MNEPDANRCLIGYSDKEAFAATKGLQPGVSVSEGIRAALKALAKG
jgi:hypothetical protein